MAVGATDLGPGVVGRPIGLVVCVVGCASLTQLNAEPIGARLMALADRHRGGHLVLDLSRVSFLSCAAITRFIHLNERVRSSRGRLSLVNVRPDVGQVFKIARVDTVLGVYVAREVVIPAPRAASHEAADPTGLAPRSARRVRAAPECRHVVGIADGDGP